MTGKLYSRASRVKLYLDLPVVVVSLVQYCGGYYNNPKKE